MTNARCPLLALSGRSIDTRKCPLSGASGHSLRSAKWFGSEFHLSARIECVSLDRCGARCARARSTGTRRRVDHRNRARRCGRSRNRSAMSEYQPLRPLVRWPLMAQRGHLFLHRTCPLSGAKRTSRSVGVFSFRISAISRHAAII